MTTTELAEVEAWKDDEIIAEIGQQFATTWGTTRRGETRQIYDNMMLGCLCPAIAESLLRGKDSLPPLPGVAAYFDKVQTDSKLPRVAL